MLYNPERFALHGEGVPAEVLPPDPEKSREARAGRVRLAMLAGHPDLDEQKTASALALLEDTTAGITVAGLLMDLAHFCDLKGYRFDQVFACAKELYLEDTAGEGMQLTFLTP
jgi:hypothetical protein